jgi:hypothetical protein
MIDIYVADAPVVDAAAIAVGDDLDRWRPVGHLRVESSREGAGKVNDDGRGNCVGLPRDLVEVLSPGKRRSGPRQSPLPW